MQLFVRLLSGQTVALDVSPGVDTAADVLESLAGREAGVAVEHRLSLGRQQLVAGRTLDHYDVLPGSTMHLTAGLRGGGFGDADEDDEDDEDAGGFGDADEDDEEEDDGAGFGDADEDDEDIGEGFDVEDFDEEEEESPGFGEDADEEEEAAGPKKGQSFKKAPSVRKKAGGDGGDEPEKPASPTLFAAYAAKEFQNGAVSTYEHPSMTKERTEPLTNVVGPIDRAACMAIWNQLLVFMGDKPATENPAPSAYQRIAKLCKEGIDRPGLRKEIYCQLMKQLHANPSRTSMGRGWILMNMYLGCFEPPEELHEPLRQFISYGPSTFEQFGLTKLNRMILNGGRRNPPLQAEFVVVKQRKYLELPVVIGGAECVMVLSDSLVTSSELIASTCQKIGLKSSKGFGVYLKAGGISSSLGEGTNKVLDGIIDCEAATGVEGHWTLELRKELMAPWHPDIKADDDEAASVMLTQIYAGVLSGHFKLVDLKAVAEHVALRYYLEHGDEVDPAAIKATVEMTVPAKHITGKGKKASKTSHTLDSWVEIIEKAHAKLPAVRKGEPKHNVMMTVINHAEVRWPHLFAANFAAKKTRGGQLSVDDAMVSISKKHLHVINPKNNRSMAKFAWKDMSTIKAERTYFIFTTSVGERWDFDVRKDGPSEYFAALANRMAEHAKA